MRTCSSNSHATIGGVQFNVLAKNAAAGLAHDLEAYHGGRLGSGDLNPAEPNRRPTMHAFMTSWSVIGGLYNLAMSARENETIVCLARETSIFDVICFTRGANFF